MGLHKVDNKGNLRMNICKYVQSQLELHSSMQPQDIIKLCYQAAFGAEHLLLDKQRASNYFNEEFANTKPCAGNLYEQISDNIYRINLAVWKATGLPSEWLFEMFVNSMKPVENGKNLFLEYLDTIDEHFCEFHLAFSWDEWTGYRDHYLEDGLHAVHHSQAYRDAEKPAYRIVNARFIRLLPLLQKASQLATTKTVKVIVIDGRAASGKSTMADDLKLILGAGIIHMDDFFLPPELRTPERFEMPGGNVHYERFIEEVLPNISNEQEFNYRKFDCHIMNYSDTPRHISSTKWRVVEGAYSLHPILGEYADLKVFLTIDPETQMERITNRNGVEIAERFRTAWIPMEEAYYEYCQIKEKCNLVL